MTCAGTCDIGSIIKIRDCKAKSNADATFVVSSLKGGKGTRALRAKAPKAPQTPKEPNAPEENVGGYQYRVANTDLCLTVDRSQFMKVGTNVNGIAITLRSCTTNDPRQLFTNQPSAKFEIRTLASKDKCLTQHHHPKPDEIVYVESCSLAHATKTGYWAAY
jgi:hypothetical protein